MIRELVNGRTAEYRGSKIRFPWASRSRAEVWVAGYGPKALKLIGEVGDGFILQLADPTSPSGRSARSARPPRRPGATPTTS